MTIKLLLLVPMLAVAACGDRADNSSGMNLSITGADDTNSDNASDVDITTDSKSGKVELKIPGFEAKLDIPKGLIENSDFDIDGAELFPGSRVTNVNVNAQDEAGGGASEVKVGFVSPATPTKVRDWFIKGFAENSVSATANATGLTGTDAEGKPFVITLSANGTDKTTGLIVMTDKK